jgi:hypothetical protein
MRAPLTAQKSLIAKNNTQMKAALGIVQEMNHQAMGLGFQTAFVQPALNMKLDSTRQMAVTNLAFSPLA